MSGRAVFIAVFASRRLHWLDLPQSLVSFALRFLSIRDHLRAASANKFLAKIGKSRASWAVIDLEHHFEFTIFRTRHNPTQTLHRLSYARPQTIRALEIWFLSPESVQALKLMLPTVEELRINVGYLLQSIEAGVRAPRLRKLWLVWRADWAIKGPGISQFCQVMRWLRSCEALVSVSLTRLLEPLDYVDSAGYADFLALPVVAIENECDNWGYIAPPADIAAYKGLPLTSLRSSSFADVAFCKQLPAAFPNLTRVLCREMKGFSDQSLAAICKLPLVHLDLASVSVSAQGLRAVHGASLTELTLYNLTDIPSTAYKQLFSSLKQLTSLDVGYCLGADTELCHLAAIGSLRSFYWASEFADAGAAALSAVSRMTALENFKLCLEYDADEGFSDQHLLQLAQSKAMVTLRTFKLEDVAFDKFSFATVSALARLPRLRMLTVKVESNLKALIAACAETGAFPALEELNIHTEADYHSEPRVPSLDLDPDLLFRAKCNARCRNTPIRCRIYGVVVGPFD